MKIIANLRTLLIALWLGAALFFSFAVAPSAFGVLPSRELAASVVNKTLAVVNYAGLIIGLILVATSFSFRPRMSFRPYVRQTRERIEQALLLLMTAACAVGQFVVSTKIRDLREQIGQPIENLAADDALRVAFDDWHGYSVLILTVAMISAMIVFFLLAARANNLENR